MLFFTCFLISFNNAYLENDFSYLANDLPKPYEDTECRMCFIPHCEHAAVWVLREEHNKYTCDKLGNTIALLIANLKNNAFCQSLDQQLCDHVSVGGMTSSCHDDVDFDSVFYHNLLDCLPDTLYHLLDKIFPQTKKIHGKKSSMHYRSPQLNKRDMAIQLEEWKKETFF